MILLTVLFATYVYSQTTTAATTDSGFDLGDKVKEILTGAAAACNNKYISGPYLESVLCGGLVPDEYTQKLGITFGPATPWCRGLACAYRAMGCPAPTYRVEALIIKATGNAEQGCLESIGVDQCTNLAKFIAKGAVKPMKKRMAELTYADLTAEERYEAMEVAAHALRMVHPHTIEGLDAIVPARKRADIGDTLVDNLQVCSPLIALGLQLLQTQLGDKIPVNLGSLLGPCGDVCNYAICALNILCAQEAAPLITTVNAQRAGMCPALDCPSFEKAPPSVCVTANVQCPAAPTAATCMPPNIIAAATKTAVDKCCVTCDMPCKGVNCPPSLRCNEPTWPACISQVIAKYDQYDCCPQCIDPCATKRNMCPPAPTSCSNGLILGPSRPGDCCLSCQPKCAGVSCDGKPSKASDCPNMIYVPPKNTEADNPNKCSDCCGSCMPGAVTGPNIIYSGASASLLSFVVALVASFALLAF